MQTLDLFFAVACLMIPVVPEAEKNVAEWEENLHIRCAQ
jgi:hypothetical protein